MSQPGDVTGEIGDFRPARHAPPRGGVVPPPTPATRETLELLHVLAEEAKKQTALLRILVERGAARASSGQGGQGERRVERTDARGGGGEVASPETLDGPDGDPLVRGLPKKWTGADFIGMHYSETSPDFLDCVADFKDFCADRPRDDKEKRAVPFKRRDAAIARGWAERLRKGWRASGAPARPHAQDADDDGSLDL